MDRDAYEKLPPAMQLRVLSQVVLDGKPLAEIEVGKRPFQPRFDFRIRRQGGYQWASETSTEGLAYWLGKYREGAAKGGQWASKDAKAAKELERWLAWRQWEPRTVWRGERFHVASVAAPPSDKPAIHQFEAKKQSDATTNEDEINYGNGDDGDASPYG
jgi:hypothetical protein